MLISFFFSFCDFHMYCDIITFPSLNYGKAAEVY